MLGHALRIEQLEDRKLMTVSANFAASSGILTITSDAASDMVNVEGSGVAGQLRVSANGGFGALFSGVRSIRANLGGGNDHLLIAAIQIGGGVTINMGSGSDQFRLYTRTFLPSSMDGNVMIGGPLTANMGNNVGDFVDVHANLATFGIFVGGNVALHNVADVDLNGNGGSSLSETIDIHVGGNLTIGLSSFGDVNSDGLNVDIDDLNVLGTTTINGSSAADRVQITESTFARRVVVSLGAGDDLLDLDLGAGFRNRFFDRFTFYGGSGFDTFDNNTDNVFAFQPVLSSVEATV